MKAYYVYMVMCTDGTFYIGVTNDVEHRFGEHNFGIDPDCYTYTRRPVVLMYVSEFTEVWDAIACEKRLKGWSHAKKSALARGDWKLICTLSNAKRRPAVSP